MKHLLLLILVTVSFAQQHIKLEGAANFRDIGGYPAAGGKRIKPGLVFRSDALFKLTDADYEKLSKLGISTVCDFRTSFERQREATNWRAKPEPATMNPEMGGGGQPGQDPTRAFMGPLLAASAESPEKAQAVGDQLMRDGMVRMVTEEAPQIGKMLKALAATDKPFLYHCTAGKDRTGVSTAILMKILGVPEESIYEDYLLINKIQPPAQFASLMAKRLEAYAGRPVDPKAFEPLMGTKREWLTAGFAAMGDFDTYRRDKLGLSDAEAAKLRSRLLEAAR
jgi:protein-tyrosine phosphatase